jgi:hypothetical protein
MKKTSLNFLTLAAATLFSLPVLAGDSAIVQDSSQINTQNGDGNISSQNAQQSSKVDNRRGSNTGTVQYIRQDSLQAGERNTSMQDSKQVSRDENRRDSLEEQESSNP